MVLLLYFRMWHRCIIYWGSIYYPVSTEIHCG